MIPIWVSGYINKPVPFLDLGRDPNGWDCYGLLYWCLRYHFNINIPIYNAEYSDTKSYKLLARLINSGISEWSKIDESSVKPGDSVLLRMHNLPIHLGLVVDKGKMLHITKGIETCIERYNSTLWRNRVLGFYRFIGDNNE